MRLRRAVRPTLALFHPRRHDDEVGAHSSSMYHVHLQSVRRRLESEEVHDVGMPQLCQHTQLRRSHDRSGRHVLHGNASKLVVRGGEHDTLRASTQDSGGTAAGGLVPVQVGHGVTDIMPLADEPRCVVCEQAVAAPCLQQTVVRTPPRTRLPPTTMAQAVQPTRSRPWPSDEVQQKQLSQFRG